MRTVLFAANHPAEFWRPQLAAEPDTALWDLAISRAPAGLPYLARLAGDRIEPVLGATLGEGQFGAGHWRLSSVRSVYYRHPEWMQSLDVEYDASFFDSDPFEPVPGGTMSLRPFAIGRFLELPCTLAQDFTLTDVLGERRPRLWLEKTAYLRRFCGMALVNSPPDYLQEPCHERVYRAFLEELSGDPGCWNALPREVARWWRRRDAARSVEALPGARIGLVMRNGSGETEVVS